MIDRGLCGLYNDRKKITLSLENRKGVCKEDV